MGTKKRVTYYRDPDGGYHGVTTESPKGFTGAVYVGKGPDVAGGLETIQERPYAVNHLKHWEQVGAADMPDEWFEAIGYEERPKPAAPVAPPLEPERIEVEFVPWPVRRRGGLMDDPRFWPTTIILFVVFWFLLRGFF